MKSILTVARLHITLILQDRATYIQAFAVPAVLMVILGLAINQENFDTHLLIDIVDNDQSDLSAELIDSLRSASTTDTVIICLYGDENLPEDCDLESDDTFDDAGEQRIQDQVVTAAVIIPADFGDALQNGETATIEYRSDEQLNTQTVASTTVQTAISQLGSSITIARVGTEIAAQEFDPYVSEADRKDAFTRLLTEATAALETPPVVVNPVSSGDEIAPGFGSRQSVPGMGSMFVMFSLLSLSQFLVEERLQGTLQRLFTMPTAKVNIVLGKIAGAFAFGVFQYTVFILLGIPLGVDWGSDPFAVAALVIAFCLAGTALGFLLATFVRTVAQAGSMITLFGLILAPLGGAWWPLTIVPDFMRIIGHLSPIAWVLDGFREIIYYNGTLVDVLPMVGALLIFALVFATAAVLNFRYE